MIKRVALRLLRSTVATAGGLLAAKLASDPRLVFLAPILQGLGKALRSKYPKAGPLIPF
jgi:hypothetical protein